MPRCAGRLEQDHLVDEPVEEPAQGFGGQALGVGARGLGDRPGGRRCKNSLFSTRRTGRPRSLPWTSPATRETGPRPSSRPQAEAARRAKAARADDERRRPAVLLLSHLF
ncbi:MAG: hypothetical protein MZV64_50080 [Ignavibacteriales bacterium]|nr:hypothetical protein [Ignavibacteriales bacterium]